jgi:hypothetical protein
MKKYRIKCSFSESSCGAYRMVYMPQVKNLWWWLDLTKTYYEHTKTRESAMNFIQDIKDIEAKKNAPVTYFEVK